MSGQAEMTKGRPSGHGVTPKQGNNVSLVNRQNYLSKTNNGKHLAKSPQPIKLGGNMANEIDLTRPSPSQISQMVQQREMRNNSQLAMTNS